MERGSSRDADLAAAIRTLRETTGRSQEDIAHTAGLTNTAYGRIERGQSDPAWSSVVRIARALDVTLAELGAAVDSRR
jgi:DNA-binding XRE family transcriptional regulator